VAVSDLASVLDEEHQPGFGVDPERVGFYDAVPLFDGTESPVYADDCCHLNQRDELLAGHLARIVLAVRGREGA
jgi:hypothetical protein